jgi:tetratricopeptide (TPR) repeat protein
MVEHLAGEGRLDSAIATLQGILRVEPDSIEIRIRLARYLSWNNELLAAMSEADEILERDPGNRAALQIKADAASWRGDYATALPIYRDLLSNEEDFEIRLNYTHGLVGSGHIIEAREGYDLLAVTSEPDNQKLAILKQRIEKYRPPRVMAGGSYYDDSDNNERVEVRLAAGLSAGNLDFTLEGENVRAEDSVRSVDVRRLRLTTAPWPAMDWLSLRAGMGAAVVDDSERDTYFIGYLGAEGVRGQLRFQAELERDVFDEIALVLSNRIRKTRGLLFASYQLNDRWRFDIDTEYADFSDNNHGWSVEFTPQYALRIGNPGLRIGYRRIEAGFDRQSGGGYFDPSDLHANHLVVFATLFGDRVRGDIEIYAGQQSTERFDTHQQDDIIGGSGRLSVELNRHFRIDTELEGGNFSLRSSDGFNYYLLTVNLVGSF